MMNARKILPVLGILLFLPVFIMAQQNTNRLEKKADSLYKNYDEQPALELYNQILENDSTNYQALWRSSFLYSRLGHRFEDKDNQKDYYNKAIDLAEKALEIDSMDTHSNFVMSVAMGRKALISGSKDKVAASRAIKKYADRAIKYDSTNAGAWHVLGRWNFKVANLSWVERLAAKALFGGIPGDASNEKAAHDIEKAISLNNKYILYHYDLATVYKEMGKKKKAISTCEEALDLRNLTPGDSEFKDKCRNLIKDLR